MKKPEGDHYECKIHILKQMDNNLIRLFISACETKDFIYFARIQG